MTVAMAPLCNLCRQVPQDGIDEMKLLDNCDLLGGDLCPDCQDHFALEAKISAAKQVLNDLLVERPKIRTRINQRHDKLTTRVPLEIVCSIFQFSAAAKSDTSPFEEWTLRDPLRLGSICKTWRDIAWANQPLWTTFVLDLGDRIQKPNSLVLTREWLERASQHPLSILISPGRRSTSQSLQEAQHQHISIINERSTQWRYLHVSDGIGISQLKGSSGGAPNLRILQIQSTPRYDASQFSLTNGLPRPSDLRLDSFPVRNVHIAWTALTRASIVKSSIHESIELLRRAVNLVHCRFTSMTIDLFPPPDTAPIHHQNLEHLEFRCLTIQPHDQAAKIIMLFKALIFHNLKHLTIHTGRDNPNTNHPLVPSPLTQGLRYIINSTSLLRSLEIYYLGPHEIDGFILPLLHSTPFLRQLRMKSCREGWDKEPNHLFETLAKSSGPENKDSGFLTNLESLELHINQHDARRLWKHIPGIFGPISDIHNPRRRPLKILRVRVLDPAYIHPPDLVLQLLRLRQEGIILDLKDGDKDILEASMIILAPRRPDPKPS